MYTLFPDSKSKLFFGDRLSTSCRINICYHFQIHKVLSSLSPWAVLLYTQCLKESYGNTDDKQWWCDVLYKWTCMWPNMYHEAALVTIRQHWYVTHCDKVGQSTCMFGSVDLECSSTYLLNQWSTIQEGYWLAEFEIAIWVAGMSLAGSSLAIGGHHALTPLVNRNFIAQTFGDLCTYPLFCMHCTDMNWSRQGRANTPI